MHYIGGDFMGDFWSVLTCALTLLGVIISYLHIGACEGGKPPSLILTL